MAYSQPLDLEDCIATSAENTLTDKEVVLSAEDTMTSIIEPQINKETDGAAGCCEEVTGMETFFERRKSDVMFELRNIQHGERPVTGQNHRNTLKQFMKKHLTSTQERNGKENIPANVDRVEEHRPDSVVFEVQGIIEQRPVSSVLQSAAFKRQLENIIRGSISATRNRPVENPRPRARTSTSVTPSPAPGRVTARRPEPLAPVLERSDSTDSVSSQDSFSSARSSVDQDLNDVESELEVQREPETNRSTSSRPSSSQFSRAERQGSPTQAPADTRANSDHAFGSLTWNDITRVHREELVQELSELVHSRLVSSTLDGEFRASLEMLVGERVQASGTNGEAVRELIQSLPGRGIPRNDFSHMGIAPIPENDNWDNISITSVSAHSVPYTQTNSYLSREIQTLKSQMAEMKNMIKISVDLQMDIQRAIRQEVAAALAQSGAQGAMAAATPPSQPINDTHCLICLERHSDSVLYQCGHMCVCYICGKDLISRNHTCPVCRAPIKDVIRAYKTNSE